MRAKLAHFLFLFINYKVKTSFITQEVYSFRLTNFTTLDITITAWASTNYCLLTVNQQHPTRKLDITNLQAVIATIKYLERGMASTVPGHSV